VKLDKKPHSVPESLLELGINVTIGSIEGSPLIINNKITDPLQLNQYTVEYISIGGATVATTIDLTNPDAKVWFNSSILNKVTRF